MLRFNAISSLPSQLQLDSDCCSRGPRKLDGEKWDCVGVGEREGRDEIVELEIEVVVGFTSASFVVHSGWMLFLGDHWCWLTLEAATRRDGVARHTLTGGCGGGNKALGVLNSSQSG